MTLPAASATDAVITLVEPEIVHTNPWVTVHFDHVRFPSGQPGRYTRIVMGTGHPGVAVLPVRDGHVGLVRQHRYPVDRALWEIPRGLADSDDSAAEAARELAEETGAVPVDMVPLGAVHPDTGVLAGEVRLFLARIPVDGTFTAVDEVDDAVWLPIDDVVAAVADGDITDSFTVAAVSRARLRGLI